MTPAKNLGNGLRLIVLIAVAALAVYWAGARWGPRQARNAEALPAAMETAPATAPTAQLTDEEAVNVRVYRQAAPAVANIVTRMVEYDFFFNPFGFQSTLTTGVVSALGRTVQTGQTTFIDEAIQTDAAINRGNSGGPLLNSRGEVIGINTAIFTPSGTTAGIGFAIPINTAKLIAQDLINTGRVHRAFLGVEVRALSPGLAEALDLPVEEGLLIERVTPGGPAERAGLRGGDRPVVARIRPILVGGDVLVTIDDQKLWTQLDLNMFMNKQRPGEVVSVAAYRRQKIMQ